MGGYQLNFAAYLHQLVKQCHAAHAEYWPAVVVNPAFCKQELCYLVDNFQAGGQNDVVDSPPLSSLGVCQRYFCLQKEREAAAAVKNPVLAFAQPAFYFLDPFWVREVACAKKPKPFYPRILLKVLQVQVLAARPAMAAVDVQVRNYSHICFLVNLFVKKFVLRTWKSELLCSYRSGRQPKHFYICPYF